MHFFGIISNLILGAPFDRSLPFPIRPDGAFKGTVSRDGYFLEGLNIQYQYIHTSYFLSMRYGFQGLSKAFRYRIKLVTLHLLLLNFY
jgi:hypothetical protein